MEREGGVGTQGLRRKIACVTAGVSVLIVLASSAALSQKQSGDNHPRYSGPPPIVLVVDGASARATTRNPVVTTSYLVAALRRSEGIVSLNPEFKGFAWSGDILQTRPAVETLKRFMLQALEVSRNDGRPVAIVAHSWGGILCYLALSELEEGGQLKNGDVSLLLTIHTPLNMRPSNPQLAVAMLAGRQVVFNAVQANVKKPLLPVPIVPWKNYWSPGDWLSGPIPVAADMDSGGAGHTQSYTDAALLARYAEDLSAALQATSGRIAEARSRGAAGSGGQTQPGKATGEAPSSSATSAKITYFKCDGVEAFGGAQRRGRSVMVEVPESVDLTVEVEARKYLDVGARHLVHQCEAVMRGSVSPQFRGYQDIRAVLTQRGEYLVLAGNLSEELRWQEYDDNRAREWRAAQGQLQVRHGVVCRVVTPKQHPSGKAIPEEIRQLVFDKSRGFAQPGVLKVLPPGASRWESATDDWGRQLASSQALAVVGLADVKVRRDHPLEGRVATVQYHDDLKPCFRGPRELIVASRQVTSVDYYLRYPAKIRKGNRELDVEVHALTFTYRHLWTFPEAPKVIPGGDAPRWEGKAQVYRDPSDGQWKVLEIQRRRGDRDEWVVVEREAGQ